MPSPKAKTVTADVKEAIASVKAGMKEFRANQEGVINFNVGKKSMEESQVNDNFKELYEAVLKKKPSDLKGDYVKSIHLTSTMGKSVKIDRRSV